MVNNIQELIEKWHFNPQNHLDFLERRGLAFENKEWWYLTLSGGLVSVTGSLLGYFNEINQEWSFAIPLISLLVVLIAWYVQLNYKREYLANLKLKSEFKATLEGKLEINAENHPFNYDIRSQTLIKKIGYGQAVVHCLGKLSLFAIIAIFLLLMSVNLFLWR